jgi:hypothetical protein
VFKFLFFGKGKKAEKSRWTFYEEKDFSKCAFSKNWYYRVDKHGDGMKIHFPIKMRPFLRLFVEAQRALNGKSVNLLCQSSSIFIKFHVLYNTHFLLHTKLITLKPCFHEGYCPHHRASYSCALQFSDTFLQHQCQAWW